MSVGVVDLAERRLNELAEGLAREAGLVGELSAALIRQRAAIGADDPGAVEQAGGDIGRLLFTLGEARRGRDRIMDSLGARPDQSLGLLARALGGPLPPTLEEARSRLGRAAEEAAREAAVNRVVLRRALDAGEAFLQRLFAGTADPPPSYAAGERREPATPPGVLLNRRG
jgi:hypothetical protein